MQTSEVKPLENGPESEIRRPPEPAGGQPGLIQVSEEVVQRVVVGVLEELKSERVQEEMMEGEIAARLKSERVQEMLKSMPAWRREGQSIHRVREFPAPEVAALYCGLIAAMSAAHSLPAIVQISDRRVKVILHAKRSRGRVGPLTQEVVNLAAEIG